MFKCIISRIRSGNGLQLLVYIPLVRTRHMVYSNWERGQEMNMFRKRKVKWTLVNMEYCLYHRETELQHVIGKTYKHRF